ncbi:bifunctional hydroxymethylpyrimidine kinase/phosphomethylpyrimidine kinase [Hoyosella sp. YIM 151337]|uniref:bifunctional hydroxymethylpyrimidine kinase/phosphomethylpyrimidine kinase n=1 Tax=Hoyosella sp. YIM 151337 TaxID=2992742 RepID=UPI002235C1E4|nr:bifunctional hydroxymethylpyrimidine kinase/phosphomethylpyrimidine kinase [Hoyosella sp. YIM 151337]MCW4351823.1 bifunctional hydroxymethylpyrimidine kinase/phosphomethylpyrimidine kinase [Hoyosella sp. YIM 151337]
MDWLLPLPKPGETPARALTIAGSDSGGGAGIQADMRTMALCGVHGCVAVTAVTVQNSVGVQGVHEIPPGIVAAQIRSVASDIGVQAAKTGMLSSAPIIEAVVSACEELGIGHGQSVPLVVDPVAASMHGDPLLRSDALDALRTRLIPQATIVTPNLDEVRLLTGVEVTGEVSQRDAAEKLLEMGAEWALIKGGHLRSSPESRDLLMSDAERHELTSYRVRTGHDHGGGDTLAASIASALAHGHSVPAAVTFGKRWVTKCLESAYPLGSGHGPVSPLWRLDPKDD